MLSNVGDCRIISRKARISKGLVMASVLFGVFALLHVCLATWLMRMAITKRASHVALVAAVAVGLVYDNGIVAVGALIGPGELLRDLTLPRFLAHALVTPLLVIAAVGLARGADAAWAHSRWVHTLFWCVASALICYGVLVDVTGLDLVAVREGGTLRYTAAEPAAPVPAIVTILVLLTVGAALIRRGGVWMAAGAVTMFVLSSLPSAPLAVGNMGEVALLLGLAITASRHGRTARRH